MGHGYLKFGQIVYILVFYNISFSWFLLLDGFQFIKVFPSVRFYIDSKIKSKVVNGNSTEQTTLNIIYTSKKVSTGISQGTRLWFCLP